MTTPTPNYRLILNQAESGAILVANNRFHIEDTTDGERFSLCGSELTGLLKLGQRDLPSVDDAIKMMEEKGHVKGNPLCRRCIAIYKRRTDALRRGRLVAETKLTDAQFSALSDIDRRTPRDAKGARILAYNTSGQGISGAVLTSLRKRGFLKLYYTAITNSNYWSLTEEGVVALETEKKAIAGRVAALATLAARADALPETGQADVEADAAMALTLAPAPLHAVTATEADKLGYIETKSCPKHPLRTVYVRTKMGPTFHGCPDCGAEERAQAAAKEKITDAEAEALLTAILKVFIPDYDPPTEANGYKNDDNTYTERCIEKLPPAQRAICEAAWNAYWRHYGSDTALAAKE